MGIDYEKLGFTKRTYTPSYVNDEVTVYEKEVNGVKLKHTYSLAFYLFLLNDEPVTSKEFIAKANGDFTTVFKSREQVLKEIDELKELL